MTDVKLHVGYVGRTRGGKKVEIVSPRSDNLFPFWGDNDMSYQENGYWNYGGDSNDIIGPWAEPTTEYPVGQWIGWNGGECPVHPEAVVEVRLLSRSHEGGNMKASAGDFDWQCKLYHNSIEAFRIVTPYVEPEPPLECWVIYDQNGNYAVTKFSEHHAHNYATYNFGNGCTIIRMVEADQ